MGDRCIPALLDMATCHRSQLYRYPWIINHSCTAQQQQLRAQVKTKAQRQRRGRTAPSWYHAAFPSTAINTEEQKAHVTGVLFSFLILIMFWVCEHPHAFLIEHCFLFLLLSRSPTPTMHRSQSHLFLLKILIFKNRPYIHCFRSSIPEQLVLGRFYCLAQFPSVFSSGFGLWALYSQTMLWHSAHHHKKHMPVSCEQFNQILPFPRKVKMLPYHMKGGSLQDIFSFL